jgi:hypothetical protein
VVGEEVVDGEALGGQVGGEVDLEEEEGAKDDHEGQDQLEGEALGVFPEHSQPFEEGGLEVQGKAIAASLFSCYALKIHSISSLTILQNLNRRVLDRYLLMSSILFDNDSARLKLFFHFFSPREIRSTHKLHLSFPHLSFPLLFFCHANEHFL